VTYLYHRRACGKTLDPETATKLAKLCGLFGSHHDGEVAAAARKVHQIVRSHGFVWGDIIVWAKPASPIEDLIDECLRDGEGIINHWEEGFLRGVRGRDHLTRKQLAKLDDIVAKVRASW
jgi:hypothetical protein